MSAITELASRLGKTIAASPEAAALKTARDGLNSQPDVAKLLTDLQAQSAKVQQLEAENKPIEVDDKHALQSLQEQLAASDVFKKYTAAQVNYIDLMRQVNQAIQTELTTVEDG